MTSIRHIAAWMFRILLRPASAVILGCLLSAPSLGLGLFLDDLWHRATLLGVAPPLRRAPWNLYDFVGGSPEVRVTAMEAGLLPWWTPADLKIRFFRPLSSVLLWADHAVFGSTLWPAHLHSIIWFALLVIAVALLLRQWLPPTAAALGTLIYALSAVHTESTAWLSSRHTLVSAVPAVFAVHAYLAARRGNWPAGRWWALIALLASMAGGESALSAFGFLLAYELLGAKDPWRARAVAVAPHLALGVLYLVGYAAAGYGANNSGMYVSPLSRPMQYLLELFWRLPALAMESLLAIPAGIAFLSRTAAAIVAVIGLAAVGLVFAGWRLVRSNVPVDERRALPWLTLAAALAALPGAAGEVGGRGLAISFVGVSAVLAVIIEHCWSSARKRRLALLATAPIAFIALLASPAVRVLRIRDMFAVADATAGLANANVAQQACPNARTAVVVAASDPLPTAYAPILSLLSHPNRSFLPLHILSMAPQPHRIDNVMSHGFDLHTIGPRQRGVWEMLLSATPVKRDAMADLPPLALKVLHAGPDGATSVRVRFSTGIGSGDMCLLTWDGVRLRPLRTLARDDSVTLPYRRGPTSL